MEVTIKKAPGIWVACPVGELDHHSAQAARSALLVAARECGAGRLVLDLTRVGFMDSAGVGVILSVHKTVSALGGSLCLVPGEGNRKMIELSGVLSLLSAYATVQEAGGGGA